MVSYAAKVPIIKQIPVPKCPAVKCASSCNVRWRSLVPVLVPRVCLGRRVFHESTGPWLSHRRRVFLVSVPWVGESSIADIDAAVLLCEHAGQRE